MTKQLTIRDYLTIARRRKWFLIIPPFVFAALALAASFPLRSKYTSQTLVLVEGQKIAENLVKPAVTEDLNERLLTMKEQILSRSRLEPVMQKFGLYKDQMNKTPMEDLIDRMRSNIQVNPIRGEKEGTTTGFFISFTADNPKQAQDVCVEITSLFMEENLKLREERAVGTTEFFVNQLEQSKRKLDEQDAKLAAFERKYLGQLPGEAPINMNMLATLRTQLDGVTEALSRAQQDRMYLESLLAEDAARSQAQQASDGGSVSQEDDQLKKLRENLVDLESRYTPDYPDVIRSKQMIASLEKSLADSAAQQKKDAPVLSKTAQIGQRSPQNQQLRNNIHVLEETIREKSAEQSRLQQAIGQYQGRIELTPAINEQYKQLNRDYQTAQSLYDDLLRKKMQSEMSTDLERREQGEQFRIVDAANLPERPTFPNRLQFAGGGAAFGLCLGAGLVLLLELTSQSIGSESDVEFYLKLPVLVSIPELTGKEESGNRNLTEKGSWLWRKPEADDAASEKYEKEHKIEGR